MNKMSIKVDGVDRVISMFDIVSTDMAQRLLETEKKLASALRDEARSRAPVKSGLLRRKITFKEGRYGIAVLVMAKAPHSHFHEFGTARGVKPVGYMAKAHDSMAAEIDRQLAEAVDNAVRIS